jgi:UvrD-like helicase C-terminal domain
MARRLAGRLHTGDTWRQSSLRELLPGPCEEGVLPHARSARVEPSQEARGEGIEAERRLAYVAFTRAQERLDLHYDRAHPSHFLAEAGVLPRTTRPARIPPELLSAPKPASLWSRLLAAVLPTRR